MNKEKLTAYNLRIQQCNTGELAVILFDLIIEYMEEALEAKEQENFLACVVKAKAFVQELIGITRRDTKDGRDLIRLYHFVEQQLFLSQVKGTEIHLKECVGYMKQLREGMIVLAKTDTDGPLLAGGQEVYAGLTYGKGYLHESLDPLGRGGRDFEA